LRVVSVVLAAATVAGSMAGCSSPGTAPATAPASERSPSAGPVGAIDYWTKGRLLAATDWRASGGTAVPSPGASPNAHTSLQATRVGALFLRVGSDDHFCTASVVSSPDRDLLITAAHCIDGGDGSGYRSDLVFIPGYRDGEAPYGIWTPARLLVAPGWAKSADPDLDVGFVVLEPRDGENIEQVLGANTLAFNPGYRNLVRVTGYPQSSDEPITCRNWTAEQSASQLEFSCGGFTGGTSGSPWITHFDSATETGHIVGVIGGYQQGGDTASVSYSAYLGTAIRQLYDEAIAG
jgi:V8-like Glu-specific endopeptidase